MINLNKVLICWKTKPRSSSPPVLRDSANTDDLKWELCLSPCTPANLKQNTSSISKSNLAVELTPENTLVGLPVLMEIYWG